MLLCRKQLPSQDRRRLTQTLQQLSSSRFEYSAAVDALRTLLRRSEDLPGEDVPGDMITMDSRFIVSHADTGEHRTYALVYPEQEAPWLGRVSVVSPMGLALLGAREGEDICWLSATVPEVVRVERVLYQPQPQPQTEKEHYQCH